MSCCEPAFTCSQLTIETLEKGVKYVQGSGVITVNFEHISQLVLLSLLLTLGVVLVSLLLTLNIFHTLF